ncbi:STAS domain-containing protein [Neptunomonas qingdaonensis]|uniref:STAS domain-containing protein n=1 Tax=Neptunomonas qingdaonensis TaxID=1045558 RepID=A0A1I2U714_9GAMM|nr:STAS domain-containing protein [Neptunomonas qingdaonensis]SFG72945.1 STAS domain-containing protein [Neptunomonas qingdaonensis]
MVLPEQLTIFEVADCKAEFITQMNRSSVLELDVSALKKIDSAGVQLLFSVKQALQEKGGDICWVGTSELLVSNARWLGMCDALNIPR